MWYFTWILGVTAALAIAVINVMWYEFQNAFEAEEERARLRAERDSEHFPGQ